MMAAKEISPIYVSAKQLLAQCQQRHPDGDYRWIIGRDFLGAIFLLGATISAPTQESEKFYAAQPEEWERYPQFVANLRFLRFAQFCSLPVLVRDDIQREVAILSWNGVPCGAIHCGSLE